MAIATTVLRITGTVHTGASIAAMNVVNTDGVMNTGGVSTNGESGSMSGQSGATITAIATRHTPTAITIVTKGRQFIESSDQFIEAGEAVPCTARNIGDTFGSGEGAARSR